MAKDPASRGAFSTAFRAAVATKLAQAKAHALKRPDSSALAGLRRIFSLPRVLRSTLSKYHAPSALKTPL